MTNTRPNPYPGPRSYKKGEKLYGRQRETRELLNLLIAERIVLLDSPSGAGKTSLVQAALVPELETEDFRVLPVMRPGLLPDQPVPDANRYVLSLLLGLERDRGEAEQLPLAELGSLSLGAYLKIAWPIPANDDWHGDVLIFDQFEEVLTVDTSDRQAKMAFFEQVGEELRDRNRWALFSMREEFVAALDPYLRPIPTRFGKAHRYRLDLLGPQAARQAMQGPPVNQEPPVIFDDAAAQQLADDLRRVQVQQPDGTAAAILGPYIEPVQLQVVCRRLWDNLAPDDFSIGVDDLQSVGDVDTALRGYYAGVVAQVAHAAKVKERALREWVDRQLITESGIRGQVLLGAEASQGMANAAVWPLVNAHLLRAEERRRATWFELSHDRLIAPVRADNAAWFEAHLSALQRQAALWKSQGQPDGLLLGSEALGEAQSWANAQTEPLEPWESAFLEESRKAWVQVQREQRQSRLIRYLAIASAIVAIIAVIASIFALLNANRAEQQTVLAREQASLARERERIAFTQSNLARGRGLAAAAVSYLGQDAELSLLLALESIAAAQTTEGEDALRQALQTAHLLQRYSAGDRRLQRVAFDSQGETLVVLTEDGRVERWQVAQAESAQGADRELLPRTGDSTPGHKPAFGIQSVKFESLPPVGEPTPWPWPNFGVQSGEGEPMLWDGEGLPGAKSYDLALSPDDTLLATTYGDGTARLWDAASGELLATLAATLSDRLPNVYSAAFSPDGRILATGGQDRSLRLWNVDTPDQPPQELYGHRGDILDIAFAATGNRVVTASADGFVKIWDYTTQNELQSWPAHGEPVYAVDISPDGALLATGSQDKTVAIWDISEPEPRKLQTLFDHTNTLSDVSFSPNGLCLATISADRTAKLWDAQTGQLLLNLPGLGDWGTAVAFSPAAEPRILAASPYHCGRRLATASLDGVARVWEIGPTHEGTLLLGHTAPVESAVFSPDGRRIATGADDGTARLWNAATGAEELLLAEHGTRINRVAFSPDGSTLATASSDGTAGLYASQAGKPPTLLAEPGGEPFQSIAFSPDSRFVATASDSGNVALWSVGGGEPLRTWEHDGTMYGVAFHPQEAWLVATGAAGQIYVYEFDDDAESEEPLLAVRQGDGVVYDAAFSPDGKLLATVSWDGTAQIWSLPRGEALRTLHGHRDRLYGVQFSPDGQQLATSSANRTIRLWDVATGEVVRTLPGPEFNSLQFSLDGQSLVVGGEDSTARIYTLALADLQATARSRLTRSWSADECGRYLRTVPCPTPVVE